jgi:hypothetical protein
MIVVGALITFALLLAPAPRPAQAFPAFTQTDTYSNSGWSVNTTRGWAFTVSSRVAVEQLGFWDSGQDGLATSHAVGLWRGDGTLLTSATVPAGAGAPLEGTFRWVAASPVELEPGDTYAIGAYWSSGNPDTALDQGENVAFDPRVSLVEGRAINTAGLAYPALSAAVELTANFKGQVANQPPVANAGPDVNAYTGVWKDLNGSATDPDGDPILSWTWEVVQIPTGGRFRLSGEDTERLSLLGYVQGDYTLSLTVRDGYPNGFGVDYATVRVADNLPPVAVATADRETALVGDIICFDGSQSYDPEGGPLSYLWLFDGGTPPDETVSPCHVFDSRGTYAVSLDVVDERDVFDRDVVVISVQPGSIPSLTPAGSFALVVLLTLSGTFAAYRQRRE